MRKYLSISIFFLLSSLIAVACGPSEETIATMTAAASFNLKVSVQDEFGNPVTIMAAVSIKELKNSSTSVNESGEVEFMNLPDGNWTINIFAQGFEPFEEAISLEHGMNEVTFNLTADSLQVMPSEACQPGQEVLYIEDFEDKTMQHWNGPAKPVWDYVDFEDRGTALVIDSSTGEMTVAKGPVSLSYGNGVWHFDILRGPDLGFLWMRFHSSPDYTSPRSYTIVFDNQNNFSLQHEPGVEIESRKLLPPDGVTWDRFSIAYYDGVIEVSRNGFWFETTVEDSLYADGLIGISAQNGKVYLDNMVICGEE